MQPIKFGLGQALTRKEDEALLRGAGRYVADHAPAGLLHAVVLRSPHAHARLRITDVAKARAMPGVALVLTGVDTAKLGDLPCQGEIPDLTILRPRLNRTRRSFGPRRAAISHSSVRSATPRRRRGALPRRRARLRSPSSTSAS